MYLEVIEQAFTDSQLVDMHIVVDRRPEGFADRACELKVGPLAFRGLIAIGPIRGLSRVAAGIFELEAAAAAICPGAPTAALLVGDFAAHHINGIGYELPEGISGDIRLRPGESDPFTAIRHRATIVPDRIAGV